MTVRYRAWISEADTMTNDLKGIDFENETVVLKKYYWEDGFPVEEEVFEVEIGNAILMQSTGLKDKNGKEIFEGDIVKTTRFFGRADEVGGFYEYDKEIIGVVKQLEGAWVIDTGSEAVNLWTEIEENEVIGNVYEQPEYLKKKGN
jgi:hypothetical protein|nr:MAG TPA: YopX protein [Caudoviricetes sp.]